MLKTERHKEILRLIENNEIETQEELCKALNDENYVVTQATVSRDIRDLHLFKVAGVEKKLPLKKRNNYPLLVDSNNNIIWIPNIKKSKFCNKKSENYDIIIRCNESKEDYE